MDDIFSDELIQAIENDSSLYGIDISHLRLKLIQDDLEDNDTTFIDQISFKIHLPDSGIKINVLCNEEVSLQISGQFPQLKLVIVDDPRRTFYELHNAKSKLSTEYQFDSMISRSSLIHESAAISQIGVRIGENCTIDEFVSIKSGTTIGDNCIIQAGSRLGDSGFEFKRTLGGILAVTHEKGLVIEDNVQIGANSTIGRGFLGQDTIIKRETKVDFGVSIAHRSVVGERVFIAAGSVLSGSTTIGSDSWIGPLSVISNGIEIGQGSHVALGAVVVKSFPEKSWLMGVPARNVPKG